MTSQPLPRKSAVKGREDVCDRTSPCLAGTTVLWSAVNVPDSGTRTAAAPDGGTAQQLTAVDNTGLPLGGGAPQPSGTLTLPISGLPGFPLGTGMGQDAGTTASPPSVLSNVASPSGTGVKGMVGEGVHDVTAGFRREGDQSGVELRDGRLGCGRR